MAPALALVLTAAAAAELPLTVTAPDSLRVAAGRVAAIDGDRVNAALEQAGLPVPAAIRVTLIPEHDPRAAATPQWIVGQARGSDDVVIFPERIDAYPYDSLETVVIHEIAHVALAARAGDRPVPRWLHEGLAVSIASGWDIGDQLRLLFATAGEPDLADLQQLFRSDGRPQTARAYLLATALVQDLRRRHGASVAGDIAAHIARGETFDRAFARRTGETPDGAAARAWAPYRRWTAWLPALTSPFAVWTMILALAFLAFAARVYKKAQRRRAWPDEPADDESWDDWRR